MNYLLNWNKFTSIEEGFAELKDAVRITLLMKSEKCKGECKLDCQSIADHLKSIGGNENEINCILKKINAAT